MKSFSDTDARPSRPTVFVSYSRKDAVFTRQLVAQLTAAEINVYIDEEHIAKAEDFKTRIEKLILSSDVIIAIISPDFARSEICYWEMERAYELKKRLVPVLRKEVQDITVHSYVRAHNWIFFDADEDSVLMVPSQKPLAEVLAAIRVDIGWIRERTDLTSRATHWAKHGRPKGQFLISGVEITNAQSWAAKRPESEEIPDLIFEYLDASLEKEKRDREELNEREKKIAKYLQQVVSREAKRAMNTGHYTSAMRIALAGEPSDDELFRGILPESSRRSQIASAASADCRIAFIDGDSGPVTSTAFCPVGEKFITKHGNGAFCIWETQTGKRLARIGQEEGILSAAFCADGETLVSIAASGMVSVKEINTWKEIRAFDCGRRVGSLAFNARASQVVVVYDDGAAHLWDIASRLPIFCVEYDSPIKKVAFSPDGASVLVQPADGTVRIWDVSEGDEKTYIAHNAKIIDASFSRDGAWLLTTSMDRTVRVWQALFGKEFACLEHEDLELQDAVLSPCGIFVATTFNDNRMLLSGDGSEAKLADMGKYVRIEGGGRACLWNVANSEQIGLLRHHAPVSLASFSSDSRLLLTLEGNTARIWAVPQAVEIARLTHEAEIAMAAFSPSGDRIVTASFDSTTRIWDPATGNELQCVVHEDPAVEDLTEEDVDSSSPDLKSFFSEEAIKKLFQSISVTKASRCATFSPDGTRLVSTSEQGTGWVSYACDHSEYARLVHDDMITSASFSPDGVYVVTSSRDGTACVWELSTGKIFSNFSHKHESLYASFSPDGKRVISACLDGTASIWGVELGEEIARIGHDGAVLMARFSSDGTKVITASQDGTARICDSRSGEEIWRLECPGQVKSAVFSPMDSYVISLSGALGSVDDITVWNACTGEQVVRLGEHGPSNDSRLFHVSQAGGTVEVIDVSFDGASGDTGIVFSSDEKKFITSSEKVVRVWEVATGRLVAETMCASEGPDRLVARVLEPKFTVLLSRVYATSFSLSQNRSISLSNFSNACRRQGFPFGVVEARQATPGRRRRAYVREKNMAIRRPKGVN